MEVEHIHSALHILEHVTSLKKFVCIDLPVDQSLNDRCLQQRYEFYKIVNTLRFEFCLK